MNNPVDNHQVKLYRIAAICSFFGALTTALLIFLPSPSASDFESQVLLHQNQLYLTKLWILFFHPQLNLIACLGVAFLLYKKYTWQMTLGFLFLLSWALTEMFQQAILIDALNQIWRPGYAEAQDQTIRTIYRTLIESSGGISDSQYFVVLYSFGLGSLFYGLAFVWFQGLGKWIGIALIFIGVLSLSSFLRYYLGMSFLDNSVNAAYQWIYPYLQPAVRIAIGIWILREISPRIKASDAA